MKLFKEGNVVLDTKTRKSMIVNIVLLAIGCFITGVSVGFLYF